MATISFPMVVPSLYYGAIVPRVSGVLLGASVTTFPTAAKNIVDLQASEISTGGGYTKTNGYWSATTGVQFPDLQTVADEANSRTEVGYSKTILSSTNSMTVTFRWLVMCSDNRIITAVDFGTAQSLQEQPVVLSIPASPVIANSYPIQVFHRVS